jgi:hypothetical protein
MNENSLSFATSQELFDELSKRYDAMLFIGYQDRSNTHYSVTFETKGTAPEIVGLASMSVRHVNRLVVEGSKD